MGLSVIEEQNKIITDEIKAIAQAAPGEWKHMIVDEQSKKIIDNGDMEDAILQQNIATIERIDERREPNPDMDAVYFLTPDAYSVDCLLADFEVRRYRRAYLLWTNLLDLNLRRRIDEFPGVRQLRFSSKTIFSNFYPRESHLVVFRNPWSFPMLYHPACNNLVPKHMQALAQQIAGVCITLGEYPKVRFYQPRNATHEASVLCGHLARFVQEELDGYAQYNKDFPPPNSQRPQGTLLITDRSMDLMAPLIHEFTYQAMAHDLLPIKEGDKVTYHTIINEGKPDAEEKDMELCEKDKVWIEYRHRQMQATAVQLPAAFTKFYEQNKHYEKDKSADTPNYPGMASELRDIIAGISEYHATKAAYTLHTAMGQACIKIFASHMLQEINWLEQTLATGLDIDMRKPKNVLESIVQFLDDEVVRPQDRLRLIIMYILYRGGVIMEDVKKLLIHAGLPIHEGEIINNLELLGGPVRYKLKDQRRPYVSLFPPKAAEQDVDDDDAYRSRFDPALQPVLENLVRGTLDQGIFPYVKPLLDPNEDLLAAQSTSLRVKSQAPKWAKGGPGKLDNRQRIIVFMAGGATYSESRVCYDVGLENDRHIVLATSHMLTPQFFIRQVGDLSRDKRQLDLPLDRPKPRVPPHLFERAAPPRSAQPPLGQGQSQQRGGRAPPPQGGLPTRPGHGSHALAQAPAPPTQAMSNMRLNHPPVPPSSGAGLPQASPSLPPPADVKLHKEKKRRNFLGMKK